MKNHDIFSKLAKGLRTFPEVKAIGISGSYAINKQDKYSDIDCCIISESLIPSTEKRIKAYSKIGNIAMQWSNIDFEISVGDAFKIDGLEIDMIWMTHPEIIKFIQNLEKDVKCDEFLPGGIKKTNAIFDPERIIEKIKAKVNKYPDKRARNRAITFIKDAHFNLYTLSWLKKAEYRNDYFSFSKNQHEILDYLIKVIFALNKEWLSDEKRILPMIENMTNVPKDAANRIRSLIMHDDRNVTMKKSLKEIKQLFKETYLITNQLYPDLKLNFSWE
jgi:hypothetical protein